MISRIIPLFIRRTDQSTGSADQADKLQPASAGFFGAQFMTLQDPITGRLANTFNASEGTVLLTPAEGENGLATLSIGYGYAPGSSTVINGVNVVPLAAEFDPAEVSGFAAAANMRLFDGANMVTGRTATDSADDQAALGNVLLATLARLQGFDGANWDRLRTGSADNLGAQSSAGAQINTAPGNWSATSRPAAGERATATRAAVAGQRHVCNSITASLTDPDVQGDFTWLVLRDGATGAGAILWQTQMMAFFDPALAGGQYIDRVVVSGLNIVGSVNTAMTLEFEAASGASMQQDVTLTGFSTG